MPALSGVAVRSEVVVKDYAPQTLRNMNEGQIATLDERQRGWVLEGLRPHAAAIAQLGYRLPEE